MPRIRNLQVKFIILQLIYHFVAPRVMEISQPTRLNCKGRYINFEKLLGRILLSPAVPRGNQLRAQNANSHTPIDYLRVEL